MVSSESNTVDFVLFALVDVICERNLFRLVLKISFYLNVEVSLLLKVVDEILRRSGKN